MNCGLIREDEVFFFGDYARTLLQMEGIIADDRQMLDEKLIAMLVYEAMARKIRGNSKPLMHMVANWLWTTCRLMEKRRLFFLLLRSTTHPYCIADSRL